MKLTKGKLSKIMNKRKQSMKRYKKQRKYRHAGKTFRKRKPLNLHYSSIKKLVTPKKIEWIGGQEEEPSGKVPSIVVEEGHSASTSAPVAEPTIVKTELKPEPASESTSVPTIVRPEESMASVPTIVKPETKLAPEPATEPTIVKTETEQSMTTEPTIVKTETELATEPATEPTIVRPEESMATEPTIEPESEPTSVPTIVRPEETETASVPTIVKTETEQAVTPQPVQPNTPLEDAINYISNKIADAVVKKMGTSTSDNQDAEQSIPTMAYAMQQTTSNQQGGKRKTRRSRHNSQHVTHKMYHNF